MCACIETGRDSELMSRGAQTDVRRSLPPLMGTGLIKSIQRHRTPLRDRLFRWAALLGDEPAFTTLLPVLAWSLPPGVSLLVILSWMSTFYVGHALKDWLQLPRPFVMDREVACLEDHFSAEYGLPSTHAQAVWAIPPTVLFSCALDRPLLWACGAVLYASTVSFSRLYLGVHSLLDVLVGAALGVATCAVVLLYGPGLRDALLSASPAVALLAALAAHAGLVLLYPRLPGVSTTFRDTCSILGVSLGVWWAARLNALFFSALPPAGGLAVWGARVAAGLALVLAGHWLFRRLVRRLLGGLHRLLFPQGPAQLEAHMPFLALLKFVSYIGIGFNAFCLAPLALHTAGL